MFDLLMKTRASYCCLFVFEREAFVLFVDVFCLLVACKPCVTKRIYIQGAHAMPAIDTRVSPALQSFNIEKLEGFDDTTKPYLGPVMEVLDDAYITIGKLHAARDASKKNSAWTETQQILNVADAASKQEKRLTGKFDQVSNNLGQQIKALEDMLAGPLAQKGSAGSLNAEIRAYAKNLSTSDRQKLLTNALEQSDITTLTAVLGGPSYLSGLMDSEVAYFTRRYNELQNPEATQRLKALRGARDYIYKFGGLIFGEITKAVGADWAKVQQLREGNDKAAAALKFD